MAVQEAIARSKDGVPREKASRCQERSKKSSFQAENHRDASFVSSLKRRGMKVEKPFCARLSANVIFPLSWTK
jgi:hypothetical protein